MFRPCAAALGCLLLVLVPQGRCDEPEALELRLRKQLDAIPGKRAYLFAELTDQGPKALYAQNPQEVFAVGSSFKLYILGALIDEANHRRRRDEDIMRLQREFIGPPTSEMASWPMGSPVTLHTLALKMISISDNTATDHLLHLLTRKRVEAQMRAMGHHEPRLNEPLLSTREMTMIRDKKVPGRLAKWRQFDEAARRRFLDQEIDKLHDFETLDFDAGAFAACEWFATPMDMSRALDWLRQHGGEGRPGHSFLEVTTVDKKLKCDPKAWPFVGFKGGSEDQILCGNWLLRHRNGKWYTFHAFFNDEAVKVSQPAAIQAADKIFAAIEATLK